MNFEYMTIAINGKDIDNTDNLSSILNRHGKKGWELASAITQPCLGSTQYSLIGITQKTILIFKKHMEQNEEV